MFRAVAGAVGFSVVLWEDRERGLSVDSYNQSSPVLHELNWFGSFFFFFKCLFFLIKKRALRDGVHEVKTLFWFLQSHLEHLLFFIYKIQVQTFKFTTVFNEYKFFITTTSATVKLFKKQQLVKAMDDIIEVAQ